MVPAEIPEATSIRRFQLLLMFLEIVYIVLDVVVYGSWYMALFEVPRLWMCYYNFMTLSLCMMNVFMVYIVIGAVGSTLSIFTIGLTGGVLGIFNYFIFPAQLCLMVFTGYKLWFKIGEYRAALKDHKKGVTKGDKKGKDEEKGMHLKANIGGQDVDVPLKGVKVGLN